MPSNRVGSAAAKAQENPARTWGPALLLCLLLAAPAAAQVRSLTILHLNDMHARMMPLENGHGGFASLATAIKRERAACTDCILLSAGDLVQGTPVSTIFHGLPVFQVANLFGFDAATLGNHEFDYGWLQVRKFIDTAKYPVVTSNLVDAEGKLFTPKPYTILKVNGLRVAVIGAMTEGLPSLSMPVLIEGWHVAPLVETVRKYARELRAQSDLIVLLAHIDGREEQAILNEVPEVRVLVTGHIHSGIPEALSKDGRVMVRVKSYCEELGRLDLKVDVAKKAVASWKWKRITIDPAVFKPDAAMAREVKRWEDDVAQRVDKPLAESTHAFNKPELKKLLERAICEETGADFAWMNSGGIRDILPKGKLLERHIWNILPFDDELVVGTFKGSQLPAVVTAGRTVDPDREYTLAVSDYTASNPATSDNFGANTGLKFDHNIAILRDLMLDWFHKKKIIE